MINDKPLAEITKADLLALRDAAVRESKTIEYKELIELGNDPAHRKFVVCIASFANASGGDLIFGVRAEDGVPMEIVPLPNFNPDSDVRTLRDLVRAHIEPPLFGVDFQAISVDGGFALIVRVPRAWDGPHMVTYNGDNRFYARDANGCVKMNVSEIALGFTRTEAVAERIRRARLERLALIRAGELPISLTPSPKAVLHLFPLQSFDTAQGIDITALLQSNTLRPLRYRSGYAPFHDIDGFYVAEVHEREKADGYCAALRTGGIEVVTWLGRDKWIGNPDFEQGLIHFLPTCLKWLEIINLQPPVIVALSVLDAQGCLLVTGPAQQLWPRPIKHRDLIMHHVFLGDFQKPAAEVLRPFCDAIWQACGLQRSFNFDEQGEWKPQRWA